MCHADLVRLNILIKGTLEWISFDGSKAKIDLCCAPQKRLGHLNVFYLEKHPQLHNVAVNPAAPMTTQCKDIESTNTQAGGFRDGNGHELPLQQ